MIDFTLYDEWEREKIEQGRQDGLRAGRIDGEVKTLVLQFELRLRRDLTDDERAVLRRHVETAGIRRMSEVVLDTPVEELPAWLVLRDAG